MTPPNVNKKIRKACLQLGIDRRITGYSLKRNGVTMRRLRGDSDVEIQHVAGWKSAKQLKIYDQSSADDVFAKQVRKKLGEQEEASQGLSRVRQEPCVCGAVAAPTDTICGKCGRVLDPRQIEREQQADRESRAVFARALKNPEASLGEIIHAYRK